MTTTNQYIPYQLALGAIASLDDDHAHQLNSVGFTAFDAPMGHALVELPIDRWSLEHAHTARRILRRYRSTQLPRFGIDFDDLPELASIDQVRRSRRTGGRAAIAVVDDVIEIRLISDPLLRQRVADIRALVGARWVPSDKRWVVPLSITNVVAVAELLARYASSALPFDESDELRDQLATIVADAQHRLDASAAATAELELTARTLRDASKLRAFQLAGIAYALQNRHTIIADDMGLGKTVQSIVTVEQSGAVPALVVCPASLKLNWRREMLQWTTTAPDDIVVVDGRKIDQVTAQEMQRARYVIINYELLVAWLGELSSIRWGAVVVDEAHAFKTETAQRSIALASLMQTTRPAVRLLLTGTPVLNRPVELWPLLELVNGTRYFGTWKRYTETYCDGHQTKYGYDATGASNLDELNRTLRASGLMIRRRKGDVIKELPRALWARADMTMGGRPLAQYIKAHRDYHEYLESTGRTLTDRELKAEALLRTGELRRLMWLAKRASVLSWVSDFLATTDRKLIIFAHHRDVIDDLVDTYNAPRIVGGQDKRDIEDGKHRFQTEDSCRVIVCNIAAGGVGHTLTAASDVAFVEFPWNDAMLDQALSRADRIGQTEQVTGWLLAGARPDMYATIDDDMLEMIADKGDVVRASTDGLGLVSQRAALERVRTLLASDERDHE